MSALAGALGALRIARLAGLTVDTTDDGRLSVWCPYDGLPPHPRIMGLLSHPVDWDRQTHLSAEQHAWGEGYIESLRLRPRRTVPSSLFATNRHSPTR